MNRSKYVAKVLVGQVNVRQGPSIKKDVNGLVKLGDILPIHDAVHNDEGRWLFVIKGRVQGWIKTRSQAYGEHVKIIRVPVQEPVWYPRSLPVWLWPLIASGIIGVTVAIAHYVN